MVRHAGPGMGVWYGVVWVGTLEGGPCNKTGKSKACKAQECPGGSCGEEGFTTWVRWLSQLLPGPPHLCSYPKNIATSAGFRNVCTMN